MLSASSPYFEKALSGDWTEAVERRVELTVPDEQALEDLKLPIKLSYSDSYTHNNGKLLPLETRLRLAVRADALEFVEALQESVSSLLKGLDFKAAQTVLDDLPPVVEVHQGMAAIRRDVVALLAKGIEEREDKEEEAAAVESAVDALAKALGPVEDILGVHDDLDDNDALFLRNEVRKLPLCVFKRLLGSEKLQLQLENDSYQLLRSWLSQIDYFGEDDAQEDFDELAPVLRYHHMTADFLANVVSQCPLMRASPVLQTVLCSAFVQREVPLELLDSSGIPRGSRNRGLPLSQARWEFEANYCLEEITGLELSETVGTYFLVAGYIARLCFRREGGGKFGAYLGISQIPEGQAEAPPPGVAVHVRLKLPAAEHRGTRYLTKQEFSAGFQKPWDEVVRDGSPYFTNGEMKVKVEVSLATTQG